MRIHHAAVMVADLERSMTFYSQVFGFSVVERGEFEGTPLAFLAPPEGGAQLELVQGAGYPAEGVVNHLALAVSDLAADLERLRRHGVPLLDEAPVWVFNGSRIAFCLGPDGELIELMEPARNTTDRP